MTNWKKILANHISNKGQISKIYKKYQNSTLKKKNPLSKQAKDKNRCFTEEKIQKKNKHMKICSPLLAIREIQIKPIM